MVVVDASVLIDYLGQKASRETVWLGLHRDTQRLGITSLTICEVLQGVRSELRFLQIQNDLSRFEIFDIGDRKLAIAAARNYRVLRGLGFTTRNTIDCLIASFCIQDGHALLHNDRDFDAFEHHLGLQVLHPPESKLH